MTTLHRLAAPILCSFLLSISAGCSGGGGVGIIAGLSLPDQMSVVTAGGAGSLTQESPAPATSFPADSDYETDEQRAWVYDPSMDALGTVNEILCLLKQTGYSDLVNQGTYLAQVDGKACDQGSDGGSDTGESSGSNAKRPEIWIVHSARASNDADQIVDLWVPNDDDGDSGPMSIWVRMVASEGTSPENPFGVFTLNFAGVPTGGTIADAVFRGTLRTLDVAQGSVGFSFYMEHGDVTVAPAQDEHAEVLQANVVMDGDLTQGVARIRRQERFNHPPNGDSGILTSEYAIAFDPDNFLRSKDGAPGDCLSRDTFDTRVWRYNLYDSESGERVARNSGFGFRTQGGEYGWIGYWGLWVPRGVELSSGDTITRDVYGESDPETYTLLVAPGKLIQNTKHILFLSDIGGETFTWWDFTNPAQRPDRYEVVFQNDQWLETAIWNDQTQAYDPLPQPVVMNVAAIGYLNMWSDGLGGPVTYVDGNNHVTYYARQFVNGSSALFAGGAPQVDLYGFHNCLAAGITENEAELGDAFLPPSNDVTAPYHYVFVKDELTLYFDTDGAGTLERAGLVDGAVPQAGPFTWGMQSGPMLLSTGNLTDPGQAWTQTTFYTYETGPNSWNQYAAVIDDQGDSVSFDPPLQFTYVHATANDRNGDATHDGRRILLSYGGDGNLFGIPSEGTDLDGDGNPDRWYPLLGLVDGVVMGRFDEYVVKAVEMEQTLSADPGSCAGLDTSAALGLTLPDASGHTPPDIGPPPTVDDPPRVIEGSVQGP